MRARFLTAGMLLGVALLASACTNADLEGAAPKSRAQLSAEVQKTMRDKGMTRTSPIMARIFKEEGKLEIWKQKQNGRYDIIASYDICKYSGKLGPKFTEGDRQAPEGFYTVNPAQMNPNSKYYLSFNIGYPNAYDRAQGRTGSNLMVHGACSSSGCYSMTDPQMEQIYAFGRDAFEGGQREFQIQAFPFRMTAANMARYRDDPNYEFWTMLKEGYDHFEITKVPPKVDVCEKRYVFNRIAETEGAFSPTAACPATTQPPSLASAYQSYKSKDDTALGAAGGGSNPRKASIAGVKEASLVADWTKARARGERVPIEPPSLQPDGTVKITSVMGRADTPEGRRKAAEEAKAAEAKRKKEMAERKKAEIAAAKAAAEQAAAAPVPAEPPAATAAAGEESTASKLKKRLLGMFGS